MARPLTGPQGQEISSLRINPAGVAGLVAQAKEIERKFLAATRAGGFVESTNLKSLHWIQKQAAKNLQDSIAANRRPDFQTHRLEKAILNDKYSNVTPENVEFLIRSRIFPDIPYYASLEYGDRSQVGQERWFSFLGVRTGATSPNYSFDHRRNFNKAHLPSDIRNNRRANGRSVVFAAPTGVSDRIIGPREFKKRGYTIGNNGFRVPVIIHRPVPRYAYGQKAGDLFVDSNQYRTILFQEAASFLAATGIGLT